MRDNIRLNIQFLVERFYTSEMTYKRLANDLLIQQQTEVKYDLLIIHQLNPLPTERYILLTGTNVQF